MNILQLGIDTSSFDETKKTVLTEYVALFDKLSTYDGKIFNPVMGGGLLDFNKSITETNALLSELNSKILSLAGATNSSTAATNENTVANNTNISSIVGITNATLKGVEAETRIAAAKTQTAETAVRVAEANLASAKTALQNASANEKEAYSIQVRNAAEELALAIRKQTIAANAQSSASVNQLITANNQLAASVNSTTAVQESARAALTRAVVASESSVQASLRAEAAEVKAQSEIASSIERTSAIRQKVSSQNVASQIRDIEAATEAAAAETRIATARTQSAATAVQVAQANLSAAKSALQNADANDKDAASLEVRNAAEELALKVREQTVAANEQSVASANQLIAANNQLVVSINSTASAQEAARAALARATVASEQSTQASLRAEAAEVKAQSEISTSIERTVSIRETASSQATSSRMKDAEAATAAAAAQTRTAQKDYEAAFAAERLAAANYKTATSQASKATASEKAAASSALQVTAENLVTAASEVETKAQLQATAAANQLSLAQRRVAGAAQSTAVEQSRASASLARATIAMESAQQATIRSASGTERALSEQNKALEVTNNKQSAVGAGFRNMFGQLRTLAYILPGIGIAGIFNLAFEALGSLLEELGLFNNKIIEEINLEKQLNENLVDQMNIRKGINEQVDKTFQIFNKTSSQSLTKEFKITSASGIDNIQDINKQIDVSSQKLLETSAKYKSSNETVSKVAIDQVLAEQTSLETDIKALEDALDQTKKARRVIDDRKPTDEPPTIAEKDITLYGIKARKFKPEEELKALLAERKSDLTRLKDVNAEELKQNQELVDARSELKELENRKQKILYDEQLKLDEETRKNRIAVQMALNNQILSNDTNFFEVRRKTINDNYTKQVSLNRIEEEKVRLSLTTNEFEKTAAISKLESQNEQARIRRDELLLKDRVIFYQRSLSAQTEIQKSAIETEVLNNEKIAENEEKTVEERISSLDKYVHKRQEIQDVILNRDLQQGAEKKDGKSSLLPEEQQEKVARAQEQKVSIQADVERKVFDIVSTSNQKQLTDIVNTNKAYAVISKETYITDLKNLNNSFEAGAVSYKAYRQERARLDEKFRTTEMVAIVKDDQFQVDKLKEFYNKQVELKTATKEKMDAANEANDTAKSIGNNDLGLKFDADKATGEYNAYIKSVDDAALKLSEAEKQRDSDRLKQQQAHYDMLGKIEQAHEDNRRAIAEATFNLISSLIDGENAKRIEALELRQKVIDEGYDREITAVNQSTLSSKNKAALDIQLTQQKVESDKKEEAEVRRLKREGAVIDRELALAKIIWETEQAIMAVYSQYGILPGVAESLAVERGILGAIAAATVLATPIPSFATGVTDFKGGIARYGEAGPEVVKEPYKSPYLVMTETISYLPKGTDVIPIKENIDFSRSSNDDGWEQTRWLAKQFSKNKSEIKNIIKPVVKIDLGREAWKRNILGN